MNPMSWEAIAPLVDRVVVNGQSVAVVFRCPDTREAVSSRGAMTSAADSMTGVLGRTLASEAQWTLRRELARSVRGAIGGGFFGSLAHEVVWQGTQGAATATRRERVFTPEDQQTAVIRAFEEVQRSFRWDGQRWTWAGAVAPTRASTIAPGPSDRTNPQALGSSAIPAGPPADPAVTRSLIERVLVQVAFADTSLGPSEEVLLSSLDIDTERLDALRALPALTKADVGGLSTDDRRQLYQLAASVAYSDTTMTSQESSSLLRLADALGLGRVQTTELDRAAREYLLEVLVREAWREGEPTKSERDQLRNQALRWSVPPIRLQQIEAKIQADTSVDS